MNLLKDPQTNWKYVAGIAVLGLAVSAGVLWYQGQGRQDLGILEVKVPEKVAANETANWYIYRNEEFGFEVKLPERWDFGVSSEKAVIIAIPYSTLHIEIVAGSGADARDSNVCYTHYASGFPYWDYDQSIRHTPLVAVNRSLTKIASPEGNRYYVCVGDPDVSMEAISSGEVAQDLFDQILSTFKFIEIDKTANWQTYRNEEFGFEVKYPAQWKLEEGYVHKRFGDEDGFFQFTGLEEVGIVGIDEVTEYEAYFDRSYGSKPIIENLKVGGQEARLILPSADQPEETEGRAGLLIRYPNSIIIQGGNYYYFVLWADVEHIRQILPTFRFIE